MVTSRNHSFTAAVCVGLIFTLIFSVGAFAKGNAPPEYTRPKIVLDAIAESPDPFSPAVGPLTISAQYRILPTKAMVGAAKSGGNNKSFYVRQNVQVLDAAGELVRTLEQDFEIDLSTARNASEYISVGTSTAWDGKNEQGTLPADGSYTYKVTGAYVRINESAKGNTNAIQSTVAASGTLQKQVLLDATPPLITVKTRTPANKWGWNNESVTVTYEVSDATSGVDEQAGGYEPDTVEAEGANQQVQGSVTDLAGNTASITVDGINIDLTNPTITAQASGTQGENNWWVSEVTVAYTVADALSGVDPGKGDHANDVLGEGANQIAQGDVYDKAGNHASAEIAEINVDWTAPTLTAVVAPEANAAGWHKTNPTLTFSAEDQEGLSGVAEMSDPVTVTTEGADQEVAGVATDNAGNASELVVTINLDKTSPEITSYWPEDGGFTNDPRRKIEISFEDAMSGVAPTSVLLLLDEADVTSSAVITTAGITYEPSEDLSEGEHVVEVALVDIADNTVQGSISFTTDYTPPDPPTLNIAELIEGELRIYTDQTQIELSGELPEEHAKIVITCQTAQVGEVTYNTWRCPINDLVVGDNPVEIFAEDRAGNFSPPVQLKIIRAVEDVGPPSIIMQWPEDGDKTNNVRPQISATFSDAETHIKLASVSITFDGEDITSSCNLTHAGFSYTPPADLSEGPHALVVHVEDWIDNVAEKNPTFHIDLTPPGLPTVLEAKAAGVTISVTKLDDYHYEIQVNAPTIDLYGERPEEDCVVSVQCPTCQVAPIVYNGWNTVLMNLQEGPNEVTLRAIDTAGNEGEIITLIVTYFLYEPAKIHITSPEHNSTIESDDPSKPPSGEIVVEGTVSRPDAEITVVVMKNGSMFGPVAAIVEEPTEPGGEATWTADVTLFRGYNVIEARAEVGGEPTTTDAVMVHLPAMWIGDLADADAELSGYVALGFFPKDFEKVRDLSIEVDGEKVADTNFFYWDTFEATYDYERVNENMRIPRWQNGSHAVRYWVDYGDNEQYEKVFQINLNDDNEPPDVTILVSPSTYPALRSVSVSAEDESGHVAYILQGDSVAVVESENRTYSTPQLRSQIMIDRDGKYLVRVIVQDLYGNRIVKEESFDVDYSSYTGALQITKPESDELVPFDTYIDAECTYDAPVMPRWIKNPPLLGNSVKVPIDRTVTRWPVSWWPERVGEPFDVDIEGIFWEGEHISDGRGIIKADGGFYKGDESIGSSSSVSFKIAYATKQAFRITSPREGQLVERNSNISLSAFNKWCNNSGSGLDFQYPLSLTIWADLVQTDPVKWWIGTDEVQGAAVVQGLGQIQVRAHSPAPEAWGLFIYYNYATGDYWDEYERIGSSNVSEAEDSVTIYSYEVDPVRIRRVNEESYVQGQKILVGDKVEFEGGFLGLSSYDERQWRVSGAVYDESGDTFTYTFKAPGAYSVGTWACKNGQIVEDYCSVIVTLPGLKGLSGGEPGPDSEYLHYIFYRTDGDPPNEKKVEVGVVGATATVWGKSAYGEEMLIRHIKTLKGNIGHEPHKWDGKDNSRKKELAKNYQAKVTGFWEIAPGVKQPLTTEVIPTLYFIDVENNSAVIADQYVVCWNSITRPKKKPFWESCDDEDDGLTPTPRSIRASVEVDSWMPIPDGTIGSRFGICSGSDNPAELCFSGNYGMQTLTAKVTKEFLEGKSVEVTRTCEVVVVKVEIEEFDRVIPRAGNEKTVTVTVSPWPLPGGASISLSCPRVAGSEGKATVSPAIITTQTTAVKIRGDKQSWGAPDNMRLRANLGELVCAEEAFTICAHPWKVRMVLADNWAGDPVGMRVFHNCQSDSGEGDIMLDDLDETWRWELIKTALRANPPFTKAWMQSDPFNGVWHRGNEGWVRDQHLYWRAHINLAAEGHHILDQLFRFKCDRCGIRGVCENSGFRLDAHAWKVNGKWKYRCTKTGADVTIKFDGEELSSEPGSGSVTSDIFDLE